MDKTKNINVVSGRFFDDEAMFLYDCKTLLIIDANEAAVQRYGYSKAEFRQKKISDLGEYLDKPPGNGDLKTWPDSIWKHFSKTGKSFYIQFTKQLIQYQNRQTELAVAHDISERFNSPDSKLPQLPKVDVIKDRLPMATIVWDEEGNVTEWPEAAKEIFGWSFNELKGKNLFDTGILPDHIIDDAEINLNNFIHSRQPYLTIDSKHLTKSGETIWCTWHLAAMFDPSGKLHSIYSMVEDITSKRVAELSLRESEERFRVLSEASLVGVYMTQGKRFKYVNPRICEMSGYSKDELLNDFNPFKLFHKDDRNRMERLRELWLQNKIESFEEEVRAVSKTGKVIHIKVYASKILLKDKPALIGVVVDQTKQIEANKRYKISVDSYRALFDSIGDSIYIQNLNGKFIEVNKTALETYGYSRDEIIGKDPSFLAAPGKVDLDATYELFEKALNGEHQRFKWWGKRKNGEIFPKEIQLNPGNYFGETVVIAIARDISDQFEQQLELKQNEQLFRQLFLSAPIGIALLDEHKEIQMANQGFEEIFGYNIQDIKGLEIDSVIAPDDKVEEAKSLSASTEPFEFSSVRRKSDGSLVDVIIYGVPVVVDDKTIAIYGIYVDITDRNRVEKQVRNSLREKEVLLSEIHHRVKNNLAVITGLLELQSHKLENEIASKALKDSQMRIHSMALIHEKLYQNETLSKISFDNYIRDLIEVIKRSHNTHVRPVEIQIDAEEIEFTITQAIPCGLLLNEILTNSFKHAFPGSFKGNPIIQITLKQLNEEEVNLVITDNGIGLPDNFENLGKRSLGLTLIKTLNKQLNAKMMISENNGTSFNFTFKHESLLSV
ncbi:MAG: PAS domain S-box protein [Balneolaceae bacterium]|nr:MAG: PAS domain S-box protein [Balneolaceae bacterium]